MSFTTEQSQIVVEQLSSVLRDLPTDVGLQPHHFLCGISAIAIGGDSLFTEACGRLRIPQRIFLPQPRDVFLEALGSKGADFTATQKVEAERLLALPHIIQERVVSDADNRADRFAQTNREINRVSDVVVCLSLPNSNAATGKPGGTQNLLDLARLSGKPVLELILDVAGSTPRLEKHWHFPAKQLAWQPPALPVEVASLPAPDAVPQQPLPTVREFCRVVKEHSSGQAARHRNRFTRAAWIIVGTHLLATLFATLVLALHAAHSPTPNPKAGGDSPLPAEQSVAQETDALRSDTAHNNNSPAQGTDAGHARDAGHSGPEWFLIGLLAIELTALAVGFWTHHKLSHAETHAAHSHPDPTHAGGLTHAWALARLMAEINRSVSSLGELHMYLEYLFQLPLPIRLRHLLRTINVLHLVTTRSASQTWNEMQASYIVGRVDDQQLFFQDRSARAAKHLKWAKRAFTTCSCLAMVFTFVKLAVMAFLWDSAAADNHQLTGTLGTLAVILPSVAVGVMSLAAAHDYEAQNHIYRQMAQWLSEQKQRIQQATSGQELQQLVQETELRLLSETAEWYSRRAFTGVA